MIEMICREKYVKIKIVDSKNMELNFLNNKEKNFNESTHNFTTFP